MQSWWDILEVEQDADLRTIKRAYAKKLKTIRQDEDPADFMELREAYEQAQSSFNTNSEPAFYDVETPEVFTDNEHTKTAMDIISHIDTQIKNARQANNLNMWKDALSSNQLMNVDVNSQFSILLFEYLLELNGYYDPNDTTAFQTSIAKFIFHKMDWLSENFRALAPHFDLDDEIWLGEKMGLRINYEKLGVPRPKSRLRALLRSYHITDYIGLSIMYYFLMPVFLHGHMTDKILVATPTLALTIVAINNIYESFTNPNNHIIVKHGILHKLWARTQTLLLIIGLSFCAYIVFDAFI